jgi:hypothetical protein
VFLIRAILILIFATAQIFVKDCSSKCSISKNTWLPQPFFSSSTELLHEKYLFNPKYEHEDRNLQLSLIAQYQESFGQKCNCKNLGALPFWSGTNTMTFGTNDGRADMDSYQFGLGALKNLTPEGIAGYIQLNPHIRRVGTEFLIYYTREKQEPGIYFKILAPVVSMTVTPNCTQTNLVNTSTTDDFRQITQPDSTGQSTEITYYDRRYPILGFNRADSLIGFLSGGTFRTNELKGNVLMPVRLHKGRIETQYQTVTALTDFSFSFGYNFLMKEDKFFGVAFKCSCPTGNIQSGDFILEPVLGRGGLWGVGGECTGKFQLWSNFNDTRNLNFWMQGELLHLVPGRKPNQRTFDLKQNGPGSRYLLVQNYGPQFSQDQNFIVQTDLQPLIIHPATNITTLPVISKIAIEGSFAILFDYCDGGANVCIGAEYWGRSQEHLSIDLSNAVEQRFPDLNSFAVLGRQHADYLIDGQPSLVNTYYCEPLARINKSQDPVRLVGIPPTVTAPDVSTLPEGIGDARSRNNRIPAALDEALDIKGAQASATGTGKIFGQLGYSWKDHFFVPTIALHAEVELVGQTNNVVDMWAVGFTLAVGF